MSSLTYFSNKNVVNKRAKKLYNRTIIKPSTQKDKIYKDSGKHIHFGKFDRISRLYKTYR